MRQDGSVPREHHQPRIVSFRERHGRRQQALRLQLEGTAHSPQHGAIFPVHGHGESHPGVTCSARHQLGYLGLAIGQGAPQHIAFGWLQRGCGHRPAPAQVQQHGTVAAHHLHRIKKAQGGQRKVLPLVVKKTGILHARRDTCSHGAQHLLALLHLAGQQARNHFDLVGLLRHHTAHRLLARHLGHMPRGASPRQHHGAHCHQNHAQHPRPGHMPGRSFERLCWSGAWGHGAPAEIGNSTLPQPHANLPAQAVARITWAG